MSSEQATLADLTADAAADPAADAVDAEPERTTPTMADVDLDAMRETNQCLSCEKRLTEREARLYGDNDGNVPQCDECSAWPTLAKAAHRGRQRDEGERRT